MTSTSQPALTAQSLFEYATSQSRVDFTLHWCLDKMAYFNVEGVTKHQYGQNITTFSRWVSYRSVKFIVNKLRYYVATGADDCHREDAKVWWYYSDSDCYEFYHRLPNGGAIRATILREGLNGNREIVVTHYEKALA